MFTHAEILVGFILPALLTAGILLLFWWLAGNRARLSAWPGPLAAGAGVLVGYFEFFGMNWSPKQDTSAWIFWLVAAAIALGTIDALARMPRILIALGPLVLSAVAAFFMIHHAGHASLGLQMLPAGLGLVVALSWVGLDYAGEKRPGAWAAFLVFLVMVGASIVVMDTWIAGGKFAGTLAATTAGVTIAMLVFRRAPVSRGLAMVLMLSLFALVVYNYLDNEPSARGLLSVFLLLAAPGLIAVGEIPPLRDTGWWGRGIIKLLIVLLVLVLAAGPSAVSLYKTMREDQGGMTDE